MKRCIVLALCASLPFGFAHASDNDRTLIEAQVLQMALPQCLLLDKAHAKRAHQGWGRWWKARNDALPPEYKRPLVKPPRMDAGMFAMTDAEILEICEKALAGLEEAAEEKTLEPAT